MLDSKRVLESTYIGQILIKLINLIDFTLKFTIKILFTLDQHILCIYLYIYLLIVDFYDFMNYSLENILIFIDL